VVGLCCTHYGYSSSLFSVSTLKAGAAAVEVLNPNDRMSASLFNRTHHPELWAYSSAEPPRYSMI